VVENHRTSLGLEEKEAQDIGGKIDESKNVQWFRVLPGRQPLSLRKTIMKGKAGNAHTRIRFTLQHPSQQLHLPPVAGPTWRQVLPLQPGFNPFRAMKKVLVVEVGDTLGQLQGPDFEGTAPFIPGDRVDGVRNTQFCTDTSIEQACKDSGKDPVTVNAPFPHKKSATNQFLFNKFPGKGQLQA
jgi:hypothetical protein